MELKPQTRSFLIEMGDRTTAVELSVFPSLSEFKFRFFMPGCGCEDSFIAQMDSSFAETDWDLIKEDVVSYVKQNILQINGLRINFCKYCGKKLPEIE